MFARVAVGTKCETGAGGGTPTLGRNTCARERLSAADSCGAAGDLISQNFNTLFALQLAAFLRTPLRHGSPVHIPHCGQFPGQEFTGPISAAETAWPQDA